MTRSADAGFTLIETLVALAVLATSSVALLGATEAHIARIGDLEARAAAQWAAENLLAELTLGQPANDVPVSILGISVVLESSNTPTSDPHLSRVEIIASEVSDAQVYARLTGFLDVGGSP